MRVHVYLDDELVAEVDRRVGPRRRGFARRGRTRSQADCLVAAAAVGAGARLATSNPGDLPMSELAVEHRPAGE
jgi:predicted nucleic acid-binding protein